MKNAHGDLGRKVWIARLALSRKAPPAEILADLAMDMRDPGPALVWLVAYEPTVAERAIKLLFASRASHAALEVIEQVMHDNDVPDERKLELATISTREGVAYGPECYADPEALLHLVHERMRRVLPDSLGSLLALLRMFGLEEGDPREEEFLLLCDLGERLGPPLGPGLLCVLAVIGNQYGFAEERCARVLGIAAAANDARAMWMIAEMARLPGTGRLAPIVERFARDVRPPVLPAEEVWALGVDGTGGCGISILAPSAMTLFSADFEGISQVGSAFVSTAEARRMAQLGGVRIPLEAARRVAARALAAHAETCRPVPGLWLLARPFLGPEPIEAICIAPDLSAYRAEPQVAGSELLAQRFPWSTYECTSREATEFVLGRRSVRGNEFERYVHDIVCAPLERIRILRCMAETLEIEALAGRADANAAAYGLYRALADGAVWETVPFIRALARRSIKEIREARRL